MAILDGWYNYLKLKYKDYEFDGVIISDDAALQFAKRYLANDERFTLS